MVVIKVEKQVVEEIEITLPVYLYNRYFNSKHEDWSMISEDFTVYSIQKDLSENGVEYTISEFKFNDADGAHRYIANTQSTVINAFVFEEAYREMVRYTKAFKTLTKMENPDA